MRILFLHDWQPDWEQEYQWTDGLAAALKELMIRGHEITVVTCGNQDAVIPNKLFDIHVCSDIKELTKRLKPQVILHWGDFTRPNAQPLSELGIPMAICFAGGEAVNYNTPYFNHIFVESNVYKEKLENAGYDNVSIAFGTNTDLFKPIASQVKVFDALMVGTFATWKRHELFARATTDVRACAVGYMYDDHETDCWEICEKEGNLVLPHLSAHAISRLYASAKCVIIPSMSSGGSQRTVLEAMACNIPLIVTDSDKFDYASGRAFRAEPTVESIRGYMNTIIDGDYEVETRQYVLDNWSEFCYADALEKGLSKLL